MTPLIEIICDGGPAYGMGHLYRSGELGRHMAARGFRVRVQAASDVGEKILQNVPGEKGDAGIIIIDLPYDGSAYVDMARTAGLPVLGLDYHGASAPDLAVSLFDVSGVPTKARRQIGLQYAIIRSDILTLGTPAGGSGVLIMIGGGDIKNSGMDTAMALCRQGEQVSLVRGPLNRGIDDIPDIERLQIFDDPLDLVDHMAGCSWAVANGGTSMLELMRLGKAVHVIAQTAPEQVFAESIFKKGGLLGVGASTVTVPNQNSRAQVGNKAAGLVDGRGLDRLAGFIEGLLK